MTTGTVYLVGAGPGDPRLITLRGAECLKQADIVLYDGLVNPALLRLTRGRCERTARNQSSADGIVPQGEVNRRLVEYARAGLTVVRLKGGDPYIFGRGSEEAAALDAAGIPYEVVPGITAAQAGAEYAGFSFTHRDVSSAVAFVTAHEEPGRSEPRIDYRSLASFPGTVVFYMGLGRLPEVCRQLIEAGRLPQTSAAVVSQASLTGQQVVIGDLASLPQKVADAGIRPPSLIVVGECVGLRDGLSWFERLPLKGSSVGITRSSDQAAGTAEEVVRRGGEPVLMPLIETLFDSDRSSAALTEDALVWNQLSRFQWLIFTSANGVEGFRRQLRKRHLDGRALHAARIAVVGRATAEALESAGLYADVVPPDFSAESLLSEIRDQLAGCECLWIRGERARDTIATGIREAGGTLTESIVYRTLDTEVLPSDVLDRIVTGQINWIGLSSPAIAQGLARVISAAGVNPQQIRSRIATISPLTTTAARDAGLTVCAEASDHTWNGILDAIARVESPRSVRRDEFSR
ncbi:MAG: uroporphyrinogen-III C-methyltransferase [Planctomycetaceae bacterium]|nr:uroporphyrinogen-III C-methyltransferase [Planctomycetaceae bacterium]